MRRFDDVRAVEELRRGRARGRVADEEFGEGARAEAEDVRSAATDGGFDDGAVRSGRHGLAEPLGAAEARAAGHGRAPDFFGCFPPVVAA